MGKFFLLHETKLDHRDIKIKREALKSGFNLVEIDIYKTLFSYDGIKGVDFKAGDIVWLTSNALTGHSILKNFVFSSDALVWPSLTGVDLVDKFNVAVFFAENQIKTPKTILINSTKSLELNIKEVGGFPCVMKRTNGSHGSGVTIIGSPQEAKVFLEEEHKKFLRELSLTVKGAMFVAQEFIEDANGSDYRVLCLNGEIIGGIKRTSQTDDFRANISLGGKSEAFSIPDDLAKICKKIISRGHLFYAGLDFIWSEEKGWLAIEINTCAQFSGFEKTTGINVAEKIVEALSKEIQTT